MIQKKDLNSRSRLDRAGRRIVESSGLSDSEAKTIASSPFLYARLRARIASASERRETAGVWSNLGRASRRAIPAMCLVAASSFGLLLYVNGNTSSSQPFSVDACLGAGQSGIENMLFAERRPLTADEVLTTIVRGDEREAVK